MTRLLARVMLLLCGLTSAGVLVAQAQPADNRAVLPLLVDAACTVPCFLGIRPGITLADEAIVLLEGHDWVQNIEIRYSDFRQHANTFWGYVYWEWKPQSPLWEATPAYQLARHTAFLRIRDGLVSEIAFSTTLPLGDVVLGLGEAGQYLLAAPNRYGPPPYAITHNFYFPQAGLVTSSVSLCPALNPDWRQATTVTLRDAAFMDSYTSVATARQISMSAQRSQVRAWCR
ncbi:MAG: hypothetical protein IT321_28405 [Anaerolineae bacterium]|nr:hypothetical protein [Anaerolineae bacterium]